MSDKDQGPNRLIKLWRLHPDRFPEPASVGVYQLRAPSPFAPHNASGCGRIEESAWGLERVVEMTAAFMDRKKANTEAAIAGLEC